SRRWPISHRLYLMECNSQTHTCLNPVPTCRLNLTTRLSRLPTNNTRRRRHHNILHMRYHTFLTLHIPNHPMVTTSPASITTILSSTPALALETTLPI